MSELGMANKICYCCLAFEFNCKSLHTGPSAFLASLGSCLVLRNIIISVSYTHLDVYKRQNHDLIKIK